MTRRRRRPPRRLGLLAGLGLLVGAGVALDRWAPAQNLPWKPFSLARPIGWATHVQLARIAYDPRACRAALAAGDVEFAAAPPLAEGDCHVLDGGRLGEGMALLKPDAPLMSCGEALAFATWERHAVQPAAYAELGRGVARIEHFGTYNCRAVRGDARVYSEHAFANAIDVSGFDLTDGRQVSVLRDYRDPGPKGAFLRRAHDAGCMVFGHTLGPDFNAAHKDHLHLDMGLWGPCR
jgi:hypothetical protein